MKCLTESEIASWLVQKGSSPTPYESTEAPDYYLQFQIPQKIHTTATFLRQFLQLQRNSLLIHITDWPIYKPAEMEAMLRMRSEFAESRNLIDAPGHECTLDEVETTVAMFGHTVECEWNAYLYLPGDTATLYCWEGEVFDFWSNHVESLSHVESLVRDFGLVLTSAGS